MQRSWLDIGDEKYICGHSVCHDVSLKPISLLFMFFQDFPPLKGYIRGTVYLTAYFVQALTDKSCQVTYVTHSDPKGFYTNIFKLKTIYLQGNCLFG